MTGILRGVSNKHCLLSFFHLLRYQVSVYRTIGPLVFILHQDKKVGLCNVPFDSTFLSTACPWQCLMQLKLPVCTHNYIPHVKQYVKSHIHKSG